MSAQITVSLFRPFASRQEEDIIGLSFKYDPRLVAVLKQTLREVREQHFPDRKQGGWLAESGLWYVEPAAWPFVRPRLKEFGYTLVEEKRDLQPAPFYKITGGPMLFQVTAGCLTVDQCEEVVDFLRLTVCRAPSQTPDQTPPQTPSEAPTSPTPKE